MKRNVGMDLTVGELLRAFLRHGVILLAAVVIFGAAGGLLGYLRTSSSGDTTDQTAQVSEHEQQLYEDNLTYSQEFAPTTADSMVQLRKDWINLCRLYQEHPLFKLDVTACEWENLTLRFAADSGNHKNLVYDWIQNADDSALFGSMSDSLSKYKPDLINIDDNEGETAIRLIAVDGWDTGQAADYLEDYLTKQAQTDRADLQGITVSHSSGHCQALEKFRNDQDTRMCLLTSTITNVFNAGIFFPTPAAPESSANSEAGFKSIIKLAIAGAVVGLILGACIIMILLIRKGRLISRRQMEETFDIELLGDFSGGSASGSVVNSSLDLMVGADGCVMLLGIGSSIDAASLTSAWNSEGNRKYVAGRNLIDDPDTIVALQDVTGIVFVIRIGETRVADINQSMLRAGKLGKRVLGWITI